MGLAWAEPSRPDNGPASTTSPAGREGEKRKLIGNRTGRKAEERTEDFSRDALSGGRHCCVCGGGDLQLEFSPESQRLQVPRQYGYERDLTLAYFFPIGR